MGRGAPWAPVGDDDDSGLLLPAASECSGAKDIVAASGLAGRRSGERDLWLRMLGGGFSSCCEEDVN